MDIEVFRNYCVSMPFVEECFPFDEVTLVFKVGGKMFALLSLDAQPGTANLKCDPEKAIVLREHYDFVLPGYHMNKKHWNTIILDFHVPDKLVFEWIDDSYRLIFSSLPTRLRNELEKIG